MPLSNQAPQTEGVDTQSSVGDFSVDGHTLQQLEMRLEMLDEELIRESAETLRAGPRVLNEMKKRLPILLARHQVDFLGDASTSDSVASEDFEQALDPAAAELLRKQQAVDRLEDKILVLVHELGRKEDEIFFLGEGYEQSAEDQQGLEHLAGELAQARKQLTALNAELERSRDISTAPNPDVQDGPALVPPQNVDIIEPGSTSFNFSTADTDVAEVMAISEKTKTPD